ncbi:MAG: hypothetical protein JNK72_00860 [Myxococcales bacterium]|nr:hypothetical protein [Myxococcales bacterium]
MRPRRRNWAIGSVGLAAAVLLSLVGCDGNSVVGGPLDDGGLDVGGDLGSALDAPDSGVDAGVAVDAQDGGGGVDVVDAGQPDVFRGCVIMDDCRGNEFGLRVCDFNSHECVQCTTSFDSFCAPSEHCDGTRNRCVPGCRNDEGCMMATVGDSGVRALRCDTVDHRCVECLRSADCPMGNVCSDYRCVLGCDANRPCPSGLSCCGGACVDPQSSVSNCGGCGRACAAANAASTCAMGACGVGTCDPGYADCDRISNNGCETRIDSDIANCGTCGNVCPAPPGAAPSCRMGNCSVGTCAGGFGDCDNNPANGCEADTRASVTNCGACGMMCPAVPNATATCGNSRCGFTCNAGFGDCDGDASNGCEVDLSTSTAHCGVCNNACAMPANGTAACVMGACGVASCAAGFGNCDNNVANGCETVLAASASNCGACGRACAVGQICTAGACGVPCPDGQARCGGTCTQIENDPNNCGACGNRCATGSLCGGGRCITTCTTGQVVCAGGCVTLASDNTHCGACGNRCADGFRCMSGSCRLSCPTGQTQCSNSCVDILTDRNHCGRCGAVCNQAENCIAGTCVLQCPSTQTACSGRCVDTRSDALNCGACGRTCPTGCVNGMCASIVDIESTNSNNCALYTSGRVFCWGLNGGVNTRSGGSFGHNVTPVLVVNSLGLTLENATQLAGGVNNVCALRRDGTVACWGANFTLASVTALPLGNGGQPLAVTQISGRGAQWCGRLEDGRVACWTTGLAASVVGGITDAVEVATGTNHSCARRVSGAVVCWGTNAAGQLGNGTMTNSSAPVAVSGLIDAIAITAGEQYACAVRTAGTVVCWGLNNQGQLGDGSNANRATPVTTLGLGGVTVLRAGLRHACAIGTGGALRCWGDNRAAQLSDGSTLSRNQPVAPQGLMPQRSFSLYDHHVCALGVDNQVRCWGYNPFGEAGGGTEAQSTPVQITGITDALDLQQGSGDNFCTGAGRNFRCVLRRSGAVMCWGAANSSNSSGQLGNGATTPSAIPTAVMGLSDATQLSVAGTTVCVRRSNATVSCWGLNNYGQLGDGTTTNRPVPTAVPNLTDVVEVRTGGNHTCARRANGTVACWGYNFHGELGQGDQLNRATPTNVNGIATAVELWVGSNHSCARMMNGTVQCWGRNIEGQLADGSTTNRYTPGAVTTTASTVTNPVLLTEVDRLYCAGSFCLARQTGTNRGASWGSGFGGIRAGSNTTLATTIDYTYNGTNSCRVNPGSGSNMNVVQCTAIAEFGLLGNATTPYNGTATVSDSGSFIIARVAPNYGPTCAVSSAGGVFCWGATADNNLIAAGVTGITSSPAVVPMP